MKNFFTFKSHINVVKYLTFNSLFLIALGLLKIFFDNTSILVLFIALLIPIYNIYMCYLLIFKSPNKY